MWCKHCGEKLEENVIQCPNCGKNVNFHQNNNDTGDSGYSILGFCFPVVGIILYLMWRFDQPKNARAAGIGALTFIILMSIFMIYVFLFVI